MGDTYMELEPLAEETKSPILAKPPEEFSHEITEERTGTVVTARCGIGCFSPEWVQRLATKQSFTIVFSILGIVQGMSWSYFTATITTLEKRFKISSQTAGIVMTGNEISQVLFSLVLAYYGNRGHRPRWIAVGVLLSAFSCLLLSSPHLFYGAGDGALSLTKEFAKKSITNSTQPAGRMQICERRLAQRDQACGVGELSLVPLFLIFTSQFLSGIGTLLFYTLGGPYLDDNIEKTQTPMLFGITFSLRLIGPVLGFLLASACLKVFINPSLQPIIASDDPRWMGAWWLGWLMLGGVMAVTSLFIAMFPRELPEAVERRRENRTKGSHGIMSLPDTPADIGKVDSQILFPSQNNLDSTLPKLSEIGTTLKSLIRNKVNLYNNLSSVFYMFSSIGFWTYMPKYMETIFMQTAVTASAISGTVSISFQAAGLLLSGALISKYQPSARKLAAWNVCLGFIYVLVKIAFTQLGCNPGNLAHGSLMVHEGGSGDGSWNLTTTCNAACNCRVNKILPVCYKEEQTLYYSACHAGCSSFVNNTGTNCSCLPTAESTVTLGTCSEGCYKIFLMFLAINSVIRFLDSSGRIGNLLVIYRCVDPKEKSLAIGLGIFLISIFALLPAPIVFGFIFDKSCLVWGTKCGTKGNCWLYDGETLRYAYNLTAAGFTFIGAMFDVLVWYHVNDLDLYDEDKNVEKRRQNNRRQASQ